MGPGWLQFVADRALSIPKSFQICDSLGAVFHQSFDILLKSFESIVLLLLTVGSSVVIDSNLGRLPALSILNLKPQSLIRLQILWTTRFDERSPKMVKHDIIHK